MNGEEELISSVEVLNKKGISRATLNNYIKAGILPKPIIRKVSTPGMKARVLGYFPLSVLDTINEVRELKQDGVPLDSIAKKIRRDYRIREGQVKELPTNDGLMPEQQWLFDEADIPHHIGGKDRKGGGVSPLRVTIKEPSFPCYFVNPQFQVVWINSEAERILFQGNDSFRDKGTDRNIFRLFSNAGLSGSEIARIHLVIFKNWQGGVVLRKLHEAVPPEEQALYEDLFQQLPQRNPEPVSEHRFLVTNRKTGEACYRITAVVFQEGMLFLFAPQDISHPKTEKSFQNGDATTHASEACCPPAHRSLCVLVVKLQDWQKLAAILPSDEHFTLIGEVWTNVKKVFHRCSGVHEQNTGHCMACYFLKENDPRYLDRALSCALDIRDEIGNLDGKWKSLKGGDLRLCVNIGICEGLVYCGALDTSTSPKFKAFGDAITCAERLAELARDGAIWTTKNLLNQIGAEECSKFRFGIRKQGLVVENLFSLAEDVINSGGPWREKFPDMAMLPVTEIFARRV